MKHYGYSTEHLHMHTGGIAIFYAHSTVPTIAFNFTKKFVPLHHPRTSGAMMVKMNISVIQKFFTPFRQVLWDDVGVDVDFKHDNCTQMTLALAGADGR